MNLEMLDLYCASLICEIEASRYRISDSDETDFRWAAPRRRAGPGILASLGSLLRNLVSSHRSDRLPQLFATDR
jgi:hypothetical protein